MDDFVTATLGLSPEQIAQILEVHPATARRWRRTNNAPRMAIKLLLMVRRGILPTEHPSWRQWRLRDAYLIDPGGTEYTAGDVMGIWAVNQVRQDLDRRLGAPAQFILDV